MASFGGKRTFADLCCRRFNSWSSSSMKRCHQCAEKIQDAATVCRYCGGHQPERESNGTLWLVIVGVLVLIAGVNTISGRSSSENSKPAEKNQSAMADQSTKRLWVSAERTERRTCASQECGSVGQLMFREHVDVLERKGNWVRTTIWYSAQCEGGKSKIIERGESSCTPQNGIKNGELTEWISAASVSTKRAPDPANTAKANEKLVAQSNDFARHRVAFAAAAKKLIGEGRCTVEDFEEMGGWLKSMNQKDQPVYFTYCGGMNLSNKIYLNAVTGEIS